MAQVKCVEACPYQAKKLCFVKVLDKRQEEPTCSQLCSEFEASLVCMKPCLQKSQNNKIKAKFVELVKCPAVLGHAAVLLL